MRSLLLIAMCASVTSSIHAQRITSPPPRFARSYHHGGHPRSFFEPLAFYDPFYSDDLSIPGYPVASPPVIVVQTPPATAPVPERSSSPSQPLMIELQGDRYVRLSGDETSDTQMINPMPDASPRKDRSAIARIQPVAAEESTPAILVFRDGHREEVSEYAITSGILYTSDDPYAVGSWNRRVELSSLNLPETVNSNQMRGVKFRLPSAPNEVVVRP
jgi:hypothetical protein